MSSLNHATHRRLRRLQQIPNVWEGDRRQISGDQHLAMTDSDVDTSGPKDCILWVDSSQAAIRALDFVSAQSSSAAVVRSLIRAMERPHSPARPARPHTIVVRDRELQFFLRGVLQDLDITIDYAPRLMLIDEIYQSFQDALQTKAPPLPRWSANSLYKLAREIWDCSPWEVLSEDQVIEIELNAWDLGSIYACMMGMMGMESGVLLYRSLDSLRQFRQAANDPDAMGDMEEIFLQQDCLYVTFGQPQAADVNDLNLLSLGNLKLLKRIPAEFEPSFGNLHPLEGMRETLYDEEALTVLTALTALSRFLKQNLKKIERSGFIELLGQYAVTLPSDPNLDQDVPEKISVQVKTRPDISQTLRAALDEEEEETYVPILQDDLVPNGAILSLGMLPWPMFDVICMQSKFFTNLDEAPDHQGDGFPVIMVQTSMPKAKALVEKITSSGGLEAICFNPGEDPDEGDRYEVGILRLMDGSLQLFGEFLEDDPAHIKARSAWDKRCQSTHKVCGLLIAKGLTGKARGNPALRDMVAVFGGRAISEEELGLGGLQLTT